MDFDILAPDCTIMPWFRRRVNGSENSTIPMSRSALAMKRL